MVKRFWYWMFGQPCAHEWEVRRTTTEVVGDWGTLRRRYITVTRFCVKCTKLIRHKE